jgi:nucleotide-binding universal stress UspA family protein
MPQQGVPMRVLVPVDGSEQSDEILSVVDRLPQLRGMELVVVQVVPPGSRPQAIDAACAHLQAIVQRVRPAGLSCEPLVVVGDPAEEVLRLVRLLRPALVTLATRGGGGSAAARGSVAAKVLERCPSTLLLCSADVLPLDPGGGFSRILVPLDGSATSERILEPVEELAREHRAEVLLLHVGPYEARPEETLARLEGPHGRLAAAGLKVRSLAAAGDPARAIIDLVEREHAELLAMCSHGRSDASGRWFGSTADAVLHQVTCPLLVVRVAQPRNGAGG